jgi:hypothetical protein
MRPETARKLKRGGLAAAVAAAIVASAIGAVATRAPESRSLRQFDPDRVADLELRMWQAYYAKARLRLFALLVQMLHEQYHYPWTTATREGFHLARAAATFGDARSRYEPVLPDLRAGYTTARDWLHAGFDPDAVGRAELAWWAARRIPGQNSPAQVGGLIADEYVLLYEVPRAEVLEAGMRRAEAGALRDRQAFAPDWDTIARLLRESYRSLHVALQPGN